jgi:diamine N-acetyltransferase
MISQQEQTLVKTTKINYIQGNETMLDDVRDLWEALNIYQCKRSVHFKEHYLGMTFEKRKAGLLKKTQGGKMYITYAIDGATAQRIGYLISSVNAEKTGEIESIFVNSNYRGLGVGDSLMRNALAWMDQNGVVEKVVEVSVGNECAWAFYGRYGFLPRKTLLKQVKKG